MSISIRFAYHTDIHVFDLINEKKNVNEITDKRFQFSLKRDDGDYRNEISRTLG